MQTETKVKKNSLAQYHEYTRNNDLRIKIKTTNLK